MGLFEAVGVGERHGPKQHNDRQRQLDKVKAEAGAREDIQFAHRVAPEGEIKQVQALDDMYLKGTRLLQLGKGYTDKEGKLHAGMLERYGNDHGTFFDLLNRWKSQWGQLDSDTKEYVNTLSGLFNIEKKEFTGTATSLNERKDLVAWIPDKSTNVRDALQSVSFLMKQVGSSLDRDTELMKKNYPGTDMSALNYSKLKAARQARQQQPPQPPPPPMPQAQPQSTPQVQNKLGPLGTEIIGKTDEGRLIVKNPDGSVSTERSITEQIDGKWMNIPSMYGGKEVSPDEAVDIIRKNKGVDPETGRVLPKFNSMQEALKEAERRSREDLGKYGDLSSIENKAQQYKQRFPQEAAPKVGPNAPPKDAQAVLSTLPDSGASIHPRDKADLGTALSKWKKGSLDDKQLELEVAKVFMRTYGKKLEGQALNKAVAAWVAALKQSKKTTDVAKEGK